MVAGPGIVKRPLQVGRAETGPTWAAAYRRSAQTRIRSGTGAGPGLPYSGPRLARVSEVNAGESSGTCRRSCRARQHQRLNSTGSEVPGRHPDIEAVTRSNPVSLPHPEHHTATSPCSPATEQPGSRVHRISLPKDGDHTRPATCQSNHFRTPPRHKSHKVTNRLDAGKNHCTYRVIGARGRCVAFSCRAYADRPLLCLPSRRLLPLGRAAQEGYTTRRFISRSQVRLEEFATGAPWTSPGWPAYGTSRPGGRLDPSALAMTEALVKHTPRAECPRLPPSPRRGTRYRAGSAVRVTSPALFIGRWDDEVELPEALWIHEGIDLRDLSVSDGERHHGKHSSGGRHHNSRGAVDEH